MREFFQKLFSPKKQQETPKIPGNTELHTRPLPQIELEAMGEEENEAPALPTSRLEPAQFMAASGQSVGLQRDHNEDAIFSLTTLLASNTTVLPFGLYAVADGMGGHRHGEVASGIAVRTLAAHVMRKIYPSLFGIYPASPEESIQEILQNSVQEAHSLIRKEAPGGGTTLTAVLIVGDRLTLAHVGDSRAYAISPEGDVRLLTRDHSLVMRLLELGQITAEEAADHPQRNVLYRALGQGEPFEADISTQPISEGGWLLLCSDGLWGVVPEKEIAAIVTTSPTLKTASQRLVDAANAAGGPDNITAILIRLPD